MRLACFDQEPISAGPDVRSFRDGTTEWMRRNSTRPRTHAATVARTAIRKRRLWLHAFDELFHRHGCRRSCCRSLSSGVCIGVFEFGGRKGCVRFGVAISVPAGEGETISGVTTQ